MKKDHKVEKYARRALELYAELFSDKPVKDKAAAMTFVVAFMQSAAAEAEDTEPQPETDPRAIMNPGRYRNG